MSFSLSNFALIFEMANQDQIRLTGVRREIKYLLDPSAGRIARIQLAKRVPEKLIDGSATSFRVSMYLDNYMRRFSKSVLDRQEVLTKLRIREYYVLDGAVPKTGDECFVEVKTRSGQIVEKSRFGIDRRLLKDLLQKNSNAALSFQNGTISALSSFEEIRNHEPLEIIFVVHYRRNTLQDPDDRIRITIDDMISFHIPPLDLLNAATPSFFRRDLPPPFQVETNWIIEVKTLGTAPGWLDEILPPRNRIHYSKFCAGVLALESNNRLYKTEF